MCAVPKKVRTPLVGLIAIVVIVGLAVPAWDTKRSPAVVQPELATALPPGDIFTHVVDPLPLLIDSSTFPPDLLCPKVSLQERPRLTSTIMDENETRHFTPEMWTKEFMHLRSVCIKQVIWRSSVCARCAPYRIPLLNLPFLTLADRFHIDVYLTPAWANTQTWFDYSRGSAGSASDQIRFADEVIATDEKGMDALVPLIAAHPSVKGWFIPYEFSDQANVFWSARLIGPISFYARFLKQRYSFIQQRHFQTIIPIFYENLQSLPTWKSTVSDLLDRVSFVDTVILIDGGSAAAGSKSPRVRSPADIAAVMQATQQAVLGHHGFFGERHEFWDDVETFDQRLTRAGNPISRPMPINQVIANMEAAAPFVSGFTSYSFSIFDSPNNAPNLAFGRTPDDPAARYYFDTYRQYVHSGQRDVEPPSQPQLLGDEHPWPNPYQWIASTDNIGVVGYVLIFIAGAGYPSPQMQSTAERFESPLESDTGCRPEQTQTSFPSTLPPFPAHNLGIIVVACDAAGNVSLPLDLTSNPGHGE